MTQWVKDLALSLLWLVSLLWLRFDPCLRNFCMPQVWQKKKQNKNVNRKKTKQNPKSELISTKNRLVVARSWENDVGEMDEGGQKVQIANFKISLS